MVDSVQAGVYNAPCKGKDVFSVYIWKDVFALFIGWISGIPRGG
jgi:hypothetical protein